MRHKLIMGKLFKQTNAMKIRGSIQKIEVTKKTITYHVATDGGGKRTEYPELTLFSKSDVKISDILFNIGEKVYIEAHIQDITEGVNEKGRRKYKKVYAIDAIEKSKSILSERYGSKMDEHERRGGMMPDENSVEIIGKLVHTHIPKNNDSVTVITVEVNDGEHRNFCDILCFKRQSLVARTLKIGDYLASACRVNTSQDKENNVKHQAIVCDDIAKIDTEDVETF